MTRLLFLLSISLSLLLAACQPDKPKHHTPDDSPTSIEKEERERPFPPAKKEIITDPSDPRLSVPDGVMSDPNVGKKLKNMNLSGHNDKLVEIKGVDMSQPIYKSMVNKSKSLFSRRQCGSCHSVDGSESSASSLLGITKRRKPEWIMNMLYYPEPTQTLTAQELARVNACPVRQENNFLTLVEARDMLEYFRSLDTKL